MIHPLLRLVATQPQLLADHAEAYAGLIGEELGKTTTAWRQRVVLNAAALCLAGAAVVLGGVALMLWAVLPEASLRLPWVLLATPVVPALLALICALAGRRDDADPFCDLKRQVAADLLMLREVSAA